MWGRLLPNTTLASVTGSLCPDEKILENLKAIQLRHGLPPSGTLDSGDFSVEMETGTGKTYVYLRTLFELNKRYGFSQIRHRRTVGCHQGGRLQGAGRSRTIISGRYTRVRLSNISSTIPRNWGRCGISPAARWYRSWW